MESLATLIQRILREAQDPQASWVALGLLDQAEPRVRRALRTKPDQQKLKAIWEMWNGQDIKILLGRIAILARRLDQQDLEVLLVLIPLIRRALQDPS